MSDEPEASVPLLGTGGLSLSPKLAGQIGRAPAVPDPAERAAFLAEVPQPVIDFVAAEMAAAGGAGREAPDPAETPRAGWPVECPECEIPLEDYEARFGRVTKRSCDRCQCVYEVREKAPDPAEAERPREDWGLAEWDPVYRDTTRVELEQQLRQCRSDHRDLHMDNERLRADLSRYREIAEFIAPRDHGPSRPDTRAQVEARIGELLRERLNRPELLERAAAVLARMQWAPWERINDIGKEEFRAKARAVLTVLTSPEEGDDAL